MLKDILVDNFGYPRDFVHGARDFAHGSLGGAIGVLTALGAAGFLQATAFQIGTSDTMATLATGGSAIAGALAAYAVAFKGPEIAAGFHALIMESKLAARFMEVTGQTARKMRRMDHMIESSSGIETERTVDSRGKSKAHIVYPIDQQGRRGKPMKMNFDQYVAFKEKMKASNVTLTETLISPNGSTTYRSQNGKPNSLCRVGGHMKVLPSKETNFNGRVRAEEFMVEGKAVLPAQARVAGPSGEGLTAAELQAHNTSMGLDDVLEKGAMDKGALSKLPVDTVLLSGADTVSIDRVDTGVEGVDPFYEVSVANAGLKGQAVVIGKSKEGEIGALLNVLNGTNLSVVHLNEGLHERTTKRGQVMDDDGPKVHAV
jgi:hypothetical protein